MSFLEISETLVADLGLCYLYSLLHVEGHWETMQRFISVHEKGATGRSVGVR